jgi:hypothetical protein
MENEYFRGTNKDKDKDKDEDKDKDTWKRSIVDAQRKSKAKIETNTFKDTKTNIPPRGMLLLPNEFILIQN